jgi:hypothetical protein
MVGQVTRKSPGPGVPHAAQAIGDATSVLSGSGLAIGFLQPFSRFRSRNRSGE